MLFPVPVGRLMGPVSEQSESSLDTHRASIHPTHCARYYRFSQNSVKSTAPAILCEQDPITGMSGKTHRRLIYAVFSERRRFLRQRLLRILHHNHIGHIHFASKGCHSSLECLSLFCLF